MKSGLPATLPETMRVSGRHKFSPAVIKEGLPPRQKITSGTYAYEEYYSGTFFPRETGFVFEHDLDEQVILFDVLTGKYNDAMARRYKYDPDKAALGLGAIALAVIGIHAGGVGGSGAAGVCLDASIPLAERLAMGC